MKLRGSNFECNVCHRFQTKACFSKSQLAHSSDEKRITRCISCHICSLCKMAKRAIDFGANDTRCAKCTRLQTDTECAVCETHAELSTFSQKVRRQIKRGHPAVCQACEKRGFSPLDTTRYKCSRCERVCGHLLFNPTQLENHRARKNPLTCLDCRANTWNYTPSHRILALAGVSKCNAKQLSCKCKRVLHSAYYFEHPRKRTKNFLYRTMVVLLVNQSIRRRMVAQS